MPKTIIFFLEFIIFLIALIVFSLLYGITLSNLSYNNINISQLYIKYDKKLILKCNQLVLRDIDSNKSDTFDIDTTFKYNIFTNKYEFGIKKVRYKNENLMLKSTVKLSKKQIDKLLNFDIKTLKLEDSTFKFDNNIKSVYARTTYITLKDNDIYFKLDKPVLDGIKLDGSSVILHDINESETLELDLRTKNSMSKKLIDIIKYYGVDLNLTQYRGENSIYVNVKIPYNDDKVKVYVDANITNSKLLYEDKLITSEILNIKYINDKLDIQAYNGVANVIKQTVYYDDLNLNIKDKIININSFNGALDVLDKNLTYNNLKIDINIDTNTTNSDVLFLNNKKTIFVTSKLDTNDKIATGNITFKNKAKSKKTFFYTLDYSNNKIDFKIPSMELAYRYDGNMTYSFRTSKYLTIVNSLNYNFLKPKKYNKKSMIAFYTNDDFKNLNIDISNIKLNIDKKRYKQYIFDDNNDNNRTMNVNITNSIFGYDNRYIYVKTSQGDITGDQINFIITPTNEKNNIYFNKDGEYFYITAQKVSATFINRLIKLGKIENGYMDIDVNGDDNYINGQMRFHKNIIKDVPLLTNIITFINTTPALYNPLLAFPALFRLSVSGFNFNGYLINKGSFDFKYNRYKDLLSLNNIGTSGAMADFKGNLTVDFNKDKTNGLVDIIFLKDYAAIVSSIPLVGYVMTGKDGNIQTQINIYGTITEQTFETNIIKDTVGGAFNIIKRTITLPAQPFIDN